MLKRVNILDVHLALKDTIEKHSEFKCFDEIKDIKPPFVKLEFQNKRPLETKTMYIEEFEFNISTFCRGTRSIPLYNAINNLEEALTEPLITKCCDFEIFDVRENGTVFIDKDTNANESRAILNYSVFVTYGYKVK